MPIAELWLVVLTSAVAVFVVSSVLWMALPHHKADIRMLPDQPAFDAALAGLKIPPGLYMFPNCADSTAMKSDAFKTRWASGPWGTINLMGKPPSFAHNLLLTFLTFLVCSFIIAYLASFALSPLSADRTVFRFAFTAAFLTYALGGLPNAFFLGKPARFILTDTFDAALYALTTALAFMLLWPGDTVTP
jgi:hypothetical protein